LRTKDGMVAAAVQGEVVRVEAVKATAVVGRAVELQAAVVAKKATAVKAGAVEARVVVEMAVVMAARAAAERALEAVARVMVVAGMAGVVREMAMVMRMVMVGMVVEARVAGTRAVGRLVGVRLVEECRAGAL